MAPRLRRFLFAGFAALSLLSTVAAALAQVPASVPALPDAERRTSYSISGTTCSCAVNFQLFGDSNDFASWVEVYLNGNRVNFNDVSFGWTITSPTGSLATIPRQTGDTYTITSASAKAIAGELFYRAAGDPTRECTFRYTLSYAGTKFVLTTGARASWTGQVRCAATASALDKSKGDFTVTLTMQ